MLSATCPSCGLRGPIFTHLVGQRIKCKKCGTGFLVVAAPPTGPPPEMADWDPADLDEAAAAAVGTGFGPTQPHEATVLREDVIVVDGLDETVWSSGTLPAVGSEPQEPGGAPSIFSAEPLPTMGPNAGAVAKQYKILTRHDPCFQGAFDLKRLEEALNQHARQGWLVRSMLTMPVDSGRGGVKKELMVLLER